MKQARIFSHVTAFGGACSGLIPSLNTALFITVAVPAGLHATSADAYRATEVTLRSTRDAVNSVENEIRNSTDHLIEALRQHSAEQSSYQDKQIEAHRRFHDAAQMNETQRQRDQFRAEAESGKFDPHPSACLLAGFFSGSSQAADTPNGTVVSLATRNALVGRAPEGASENMQRSADAVWQGGSTLAADVARQRDALSGENSRGYQFDDNPSTNLSVIFQEPTYDMSEGDIEEVTYWIQRNAVDPLPSRPVRDAELQTSEGQERLARQQSDLTRKDAILESFSFALNNRTPVMEYNEQIQEIVGKSNYNEERVPELGESISELHALDIMTVGKYAPSTDDVTGRSGYSEKDFLDEILQTTAINARINYMRLEQENRNMIINSLILARLQEM